MPIALAPIQEEMTVARISCDSKEALRLAALGLHKDAKVTVLSSMGGAVVVLIKGSRLALDRQTASRIFVA
jgi:ferrous iron transport protein A